jgi:hypothetical protein
MQDPRLRGPDGRRPRVTIIDARREGAKGKCMIRWALGILSRVCRPAGRIRVAGIAGLVLLTGAQVRLAAESLVTRPFEGVVYTRRVQTLPRTLSIHILEIDLTTPGLRFLVTPKNVGTGPGENVLQTTRAFVAQVRAQIGINASFYYSNATSGNNYLNRGILASEGDVYSPFDGDVATRIWPTLNLSATNQGAFVDRASSTGRDVTPPLTLYNAVSGSERILTEGLVTAGGQSFGEPTTLQPRTVAGLSADGRRLILMVIDGRQTGVSEGVRSAESAELLRHYGASDGINLDGGGSSTLVLADPTARTVNRPSGGTDRAVATSLAIFSPAARTGLDALVYADFFAGDREGFAQAPTASPATTGLLGSSVNQTMESPEAFERGWFQRLELRAGLPGVAGSENPGGWFLRHLSGATGAPAENRPRARRGFIGFWARTEQSGLSASLAIDATGGQRGFAQALRGDGRWHLYEWDLGMAGEWTGWATAGGGGSPDTFTLDSLLFSGAGDARIDLDGVAHHREGSLHALREPETELPADPGRGVLTNVSTLTERGTGPEPVVMGMVLAGSATGPERTLLLRAVGPALQTFGVTGWMTDPRFTVFDSAGRQEASNDNWGGLATLAEAARRVGAFALTLPASLDAALLLPVRPGGYTLHVEGPADAGGKVLAEVYDAGPGSGGVDGRLANLSVLKRLDTEGEVLIAGFTVGAGRRRVLVRGVGPSLARFGVADAASAVELTLFAGNQVQASNDAWSDAADLRAAFRRTGAFRLPGASRDAALLVDLDPGAYTVHLRATGTGGRRVLVEVYEVP